jgi:aminoglycoside 2'-N-acetyltransferase I
MAAPDVVATCVATQDLTPELRAAVIRVCIAAHDSEEFNKLFYYVAERGRHALTYAGGRLVSHAVATTRWVQPAGHGEMKTAFIDAVSTLPSEQGNGYGSAAMRALAGEVADYDIGCLQTDKPGFYQRLGWELWRGPLAGRGDGGELIPTPEQQGVMVLPLPRTPTIDLDALLTIECQPERIWE